MLTLEGNKVEEDYDMQVTITQIKSEYPLGTTNGLNWTIYPQV